MTDEQFKTWAKSFLERTDTYSSWRGAAVEAIQMLEEERAKNAKLIELLKAIRVQAVVNGIEGQDKVVIKINEALTKIKGEK